MTLWEFVAAVDGYELAKGGKEETAPTMSIDRLKQLGIVGLEDE
jgi:hypothetical protein